jgi:hypothetical protein
MALSATNQTTTVQSALMKKIKEIADEVYGVIFNVIIFTKPVNSTFSNT